MIFRVRVHLTLQTIDLPEQMLIIHRLQAKMCKFYIQMCIIYICPIFVLAYPYLMQTELLHTIGAMERMEKPTSNIVICHRTCCYAQTIGTGNLGLVHHLHMCLASRQQLTRQYLTQLGLFQTICVRLENVKIIRQHSSTIDLISYIIVKSLKRKCLMHI